MTKKEIERIFRIAEKTGYYKCDDGCELFFWKPYSIVRSGEWELRDPWGGCITCTWDKKYVMSLFED